jgi:PBP1b-binding outer membrane lipoprotein LpoB
MKKITIILALALGLAACGNNSESSTDMKDSTTNTMAPGIDTTTSNMVDSTGSRMMDTTNKMTDTSAHSH